MILTHNIPRTIISEGKNQKNNMTFKCDLVRLLLLLFIIIPASGEKCQSQDDSSTACSDGSKKQMPIVAGKITETILEKNK
jgi:hypothetical protein